MDKYTMFENAYFGKPYKTRDGRKAIYGYKREGRHYLIVEYYEHIFTWDDNGVSDAPVQKLDIVSEWKESINEENIKRLCVGARALCGVLDENGIDCPEKEFVSNMADNLMSEL